MNIKEIPETFEDFERYNEAYERERFRYTESNQRVGAATREMFAGWFPRPLRPLVRQAIYALLEDRLLDAFGFPRPSSGWRQLVRGALRLRALALRWLPARRHPLLRTEMKPRSYPQGYRLEEIGPPAPPAASG
jgi:hypothetical protein